MNLIIWSQFALVCLLGAMSPGPSLGLIIRNSLNYSRVAGILASLGHGLGIGLYAFFTVMILNFIKKNSEVIFFIIQICGSFFLIVLGFIFIFQKNNETNFEISKIHYNSFFQGLVIAIVNPKILLWFISFFSQFVGSNISVSILILTPSIIDAAWYSFIAVIVTGYGMKDFLNKRKLIIQKIIGILLIIVALSLLYNSAIFNILNYT